MHTDMLHKYLVSAPRNGFEPQFAIIIFQLITIKLNEVFFVIVLVSFIYFVLISFIKGNKEAPVIRT